MLPDVSKKPETQLIIKMAGYLEKKGRMVSTCNIISYSMLQTIAVTVFIDYNF